VREVAVLAAALALPGCLLGDTDGEPRPDLPVPPTYEKVITFAEPVVQTIELRIERDPDLVAHAIGGRFDIVTDSYQPVAWDLERWEPDGTLIAWLRPVPLTSATPVLATARLRYGGEARGDSSASDVWASAAGVWHLSDDGAPFIDSSRHEHDGTPVSEPLASAGIAGNARVFDGIDDAISFDNTDGTMSVESGSFTISAWVDVALPLKASSIAFAKRGPTGDGYELDAGAAWDATVGDGVTNVTASFGTPVTGRWVFLAAVIDRVGGELRTYVDGNLVDTRDISGLGDVHGDGDGHTGFGASVFRGALDELRIEPSVVDVSELRRRYLDMAQPASYTVGPEQLVTP
jgi:hypothetical protein